jgi:hypothetical protein
MLLLQQKNRQNNFACFFVRTTLLFDAAILNIAASYIYSL